MHWASTKKKEPMIDDCTASDRLKEEQRTAELQGKYQSVVYENHPLQAYTQHDVTFHVKETN